MYPTPMQFTKITNNYLNTNSSNAVSPTIWVAGNKSKGGHKKSPLLDERTAAVLVAMATSGDDFVDLRNLAMSFGKRDSRKNLAGRSITDTHTTGHPARMNNSTITTSSSRVGKSHTMSGAHHLSEKIQKRRVSNRKSQKENIGRKEWLESRFGLMNDRKGKAAVDGLVGLMKGFGIGDGENAKDKMEIDMSGLQMQMAMLGVIQEDDGEVMMAV
ncbi:hypothetical protein B9Z19DRAFT_1137526 [Tuber borchii]|uniref:Uncharacterized protein n=1 Tax=Tuber borchii TaxID=42251 RepID=A0A2T6ZAI1_TUBBO|nr:hypothetical protein B9Z19DRAFT_1137526 [Tuber borchii]